MAWAGDVGTSIAALLLLGLRRASDSAPAPGLDAADPLLLGGCSAGGALGAAATGEVTEEVSDPALDALLAVVCSEGGPAAPDLAAMRAFCWARRCLFSSRRALASSVRERPPGAGIAVLSGAKALADGVLRAPGSGSPTLPVACLSVPELITVGNLLIAHNFVLVKHSIQI